jgi:nucleoid DNA-binding protein
VINLTLSELIHAVWKDERVRKLGLRKSDVGVVINVFKDHIVKGLLKHKIIKMQGLFTLDIRKARGRKIRNPQTGEKMYSKDYYKVGLKPSKEIEDGLEEMRK